MSRLRFIVLLLQPSLLNSVACLLFAGGVLVVADWAFFQHASWFHQYLFGPYGLVTELNQAPAGLNAFFSALFAHSLARKLITFGFVLGIGLAVYVVLESGNVLLNGALSSWLQAHHARLNAKFSLSREVWARLLFRVLVAAAWALYVALFWRLLLPFCISASRFGVATLGQWAGRGYTVGSFVLLVVALHLHVIFMRFAVLRLRLFGGAALLELNEGR